MAIPPGSLEIQGATVLLRPFSPTDLVWLKRFLESPAVRQLFGSEWVSDSERRGQPVDWTALMEWYRKVASDPSSLLLAVTTWSGHLLGYLLLREIDRQAGRARLEAFFGDRQLWARGYEEDALQTLQRYAFSSLGLAELQLILPVSETVDAAWLAVAAERSGFTKATATGAAGSREIWMARAAAGGNAPSAGGSQAVGS